MPPPELFTPPKALNHLYKCNQLFGLTQKLLCGEGMHIAYVAIAARLQARSNFKTVRVKGCRSVCARSFFVP